MSVVTSVKPVSHLPTKQLMKHRNGPIYRLFRDLFMQTSTFSNLQQPAGMALPFNVLTACRVVHLAFYTPRIFLFWELLQTALCVFCTWPQNVYCVRCRNCEHHVLCRAPGSQVWSWSPAVDLRHTCKYCHPPDHGCALWRRSWSTPAESL